MIVMSLACMLWNGLGMETKNLSIGINIAERSGSSMGQGAS
jgi:hypothetical protein